MKKIFLVLIMLIGLSSFSYAQSLHFDGATDYLTFSTTTKSLALTVIFWVRRLQVFDNSIHNFVGESTVAVGNDWGVFHVYTTSGWTVTKLCFAWNFAGGRSGWHGIETDGLISVMMPMGLWTHVTVTRGSTGFSNDSVMYFNGELVATSNIGDGTTPPGGVAATRTIQVAGTTGGYNFECDIDNIMIWERQLSQAEIEEYMWLDYPGDGDDGLIINVPFNHTVGNPFNLTAYYPNTAISVIGGAYTTNSPVRRME